MAVIKPTNTIRGTYGVLRNAGVPSAGTNEVQTLTFGGTWIGGETFILAFEGRQTAAIAWSATNATLVSNIDAALEALNNIGTGGVTTAVGTMTSGIGTITETFTGNNANKAVSTLTVVQNNSASGTLGIAETTPGVTATHRGALTAALLIDTTNAKEYQNTGTAISPTWGLVGTQT